MKFFDVLGEKPWLKEVLVAGDAPLVETEPQVAARIALRFIMAIVGVLFFLFIITFLSRSQYPDFQALAGQPWQPFHDTTRLWLNTALLVASSLAMHVGVVAARRQSLNGIIVGVSAGAGFAILFLLAQLYLWQHLQSLGFYVSGNAASSYFYLLTAVHGLHIIGGLIALTHIVVKLWSGRPLASLGVPLQLCAQYWHFLLGVWLLLFALLTSSPETINTLAAMCGF